MKHFIVGLTGSSGAGKSSLRPYFEAAGYVYIDTDIIAREITMPGSPVLELIRAEFGEEVFCEGDLLDRKKLAQRAFSTKESAEKLNGITHPAIIERTLEIIDSTGQCTGIVIDAPLLFEAGMEKLCDAVVAVTAEREVRIDRITERDAISRQAAEERLSRQKSQAFYKENADYVIENNQGKEELEKAVYELLSRLAAAADGRYHKA